MIVCAMIRSFHDTYGKMPELEELIVYQYQPCHESCDYIIPMEDAIPILMYGMKEYGTLLTCFTVNVMQIFHFIKGRYPDESELLEELANESMDHSSHQEMTEMMNEQVDDFWKQAKSEVDVSSLSVYTLEEKQDAPCSICQEDMNPGHEVITLLCDHTFHASSSDCEGIEPWAGKINACPLCKTPIQ